MSEHQHEYLTVTHNQNKKTIEITHNNEIVGEINYHLVNQIFSGNRQRYKAVIKEDGNMEIVKAVSIHTHTGYSLLDGGIRINDLVEITPYACAITDHGNMFGTLDFYKKMKAAGKKPIIGMEAYTDSMIDNSSANNHLIILAKNEEGFRNLIKLSSEGFMNKHHGRAHITFAMLQQYHKGLIVTSACIGGEIPKLLLQSRWDDACHLARKFKDLWGDDFYLEIQNHGLAEEKKLNDDLVKLGQTLNIHLVAASDSHYLMPEDKESHEILLCIGTKKKLDDANRMVFNGDGYHVYDEAEFEYRFQQYPAALDSTVEIMEKCNVEIKLNDFHMPTFKIPTIFKDEDAYFRYLAEEGFNKRFAGTEKDCAEYKERLNFEIETIINMGFSGYFLIVSDFVTYAKDNGIPVGPGRGSACGSMVAYCLRITELDPIPFGLLFERFLNPDRVSMPDIDIGATRS